MYLSFGNVENERSLNDESVKFFCNMICRDLCKLQKQTDLPAVAAYNIDIS